MSVIYCYYINDATSLCEPVSTRDIAGVNFNYFQPPCTLPQYQLMTHSQYFEYTILSSNLCDGCEWLSHGSCHFKYLKIVVST
jgi:hypothetical protein